MAQTCIRLDCERPGDTRGYCRSHHAVALRNGTLKPTRIVGDDTVRFWSYVEKALGPGCWEWSGRLSDSGYGVFKMNGSYKQAHRISWSWSNEREIPEGMLIDHMCHNRSCVNPAHLRLATQALNMQNRKGATARSKTGIRGVYRIPRLGKWVAEAMLRG